MRRRGETRGKSRDFYRLRRENVEYPTNTLHVQYFIRLPLKAFLFKTLKIGIIINLFSCSEYLLECHPLCV